MKAAWALVIVAAAGACGGGSSAAMAMDAGADGGMAPDADPLADTDGDGVIDTVDVCPAVADPAQVDLDGDHIGWMCDPIESTTVPYTGDIAAMPYAVRGNTMGVALSYECVNGVCKHGSFSVGPGGVSRAEGQTDAWLHGIPLRGFVGTENRVLWSLANGVLGDQDASSDTFTTRHTGGMLGFSPDSGDGVARYERDQLLVLPSEPRDSSINSYELLEPQANGDVATIATSSMPFVQPTVVGHNPARLVFGVQEPGNRSLREFVPGSSSSQPIIVDGTALSHADLVGSMTLPTLGGMFGFCVEQDGKTYFVETINDVLRAYEAPIPSCAGAQHTSDHQLTLIAGVDGAVVVLNGVIHPLAINGSLELIGTGVPAVITRRNGPYNDVYVVDAAGALHQLTSDGLASNVAREGGTIHFLSMRGTNITLARYRNGTFTEVPVPAIPEYENWEVFTTKEGAALLSTASRALVWPSQSSVTTQIDFDNIDVLVRDAATFFVASHNDPRSQPALYSYAEAGGVPQYTAHTPEVLQNVSFTMGLAPLGYSLPFRSDAVPMTDWFMYAKDGDCQLVRPVITGTAVSLVGNVSCAGGAGIRGVTTSGASVIDVAGSASPQRLYLLNGNTLTKVVEGMYLKLLYAAPESPLLLGWAGLDVGGNRFLCSATQPDHCWSPPDDARAWAPLDPAQPDGLHLLFTQPTQGAMKFTSIRTFGPGDRAQPL